MTDLYLIAHRVRGEPAFDVAQRIECPECQHPTEYWNGETRQGPPLGCNECDQLGYWWIIPTSGHRAYIHTAHRLDKVFELGPGLIETWLWEISKDINGSWSSLPDHYLTSAASQRSLIDLLNLHPKPPTTPFPRRI